MLALSLSNVPWLCCEIFSLYPFLKIFIYLFLLFGHAVQLVGSQFPNPRPWQWKPGILTTRPPGNSLSVPIFKREFTLSGCWILSNAVSASIEMIIWNHRPWNKSHVIMVDGPCNDLVNSVCWEFMHPYSSALLVCTLFFSSSVLCGFGVRIMLPS